MGIVRSVSDTKDNTYVLKRAFWNDVSEDWPFYSDEERQLFKRSMPQNLTPPGSDGGNSVSSIVSGHSSSSSHPASPQPTVISTSININHSSSIINDTRGFEQHKDSPRINSNSANFSRSSIKRASPTMNGSHLSTIS